MGWHLKQFELSLAIPNISETKPGLTILKIQIKITKLIQLYPYSHNKHKSVGIIILFHPYPNNFELEER